MVAVAGVLACAGPRAGRLAAACWLPRLFAQAWSPLVAAGLVAGTLAIATGRWRVALAAIGGAGLAARFAWLALGGPAVASLPAATGWCRRDVDVGRLGNGEPVLADLWLPQRERRSGIGIVYLHGGLCQALDKGFCSASRDLASRFPPRSGHGSMTRPRWTAW
jgi:hypothetical protein